ncbi:MAG: HAD-superfamily hydrolase, subfamily [Oscillospiraceae bacterium]|jgi:Cof subfamily protein (haloacid dehalogenase superfamily)|nr:HAD-superfamily hydrolase, subfamily [Oscillospiraceae bacterium]
MSCKISDILLVSDLDGTLLTEDKTVSKRNMEAIRRFEQLGGRFTIATGRSVISTKRYAEIIGVKNPVIVFNGAAIYDYEADKLLWSSQLEDSTRTYLTEVQKNYPQVGIEILCKDKTYVISYNDIVRIHMDIEHLEYTLCTLDEVPDGWIKVLFALGHDLVSEFDTFMTSKDYQNVDFILSSVNYYEMLPKGNSKGAALDHLTKFMGANPNNVASIGDYNNDIEMIKKSMIGAAVENALDTVKQHADLVVSSNDRDGFAELVDYLIENFG